MKSIVFMLTKAPNESGSMALKLAIEGIKNGNKVRIYLFSDAVIYAKQNQKACKAIKEAIALGARIYAAREELLARGLSENCLIKGIELPHNIIEAFIVDVMEQAGNVLSF